jgi:hypothetical protein
LKDKGTAFNFNPLKGGLTVGAKRELNSKVEDEVLFAFCLPTSEDRFTKNWSFAQNCQQYDDIF